MKYLLILILLCSCSQSQRCQRHLTKSVKLGCVKFENDTIVKYDTFTGFRIDTVVQFHNEVDTLLIDSGGVKSVTIIRWKDKIVSQTITKKDTIIKTVSVNHNTKFEVPVYSIPWYIKLLIASLMLICLLLAFKK